MAFSSSDTLLLQSIRISAILWRDFDEETSLLAKIIIEETSQNSNETVLLREFETIILGHYDCIVAFEPILIKAGSTYHIHLGQVASGQYISNEVQANEVVVNSGITVNFKSSEDKDQNGSLGLITQLDFYSVWPLE